MMEKRELVDEKSNKKKKKKKKKKINPIVFKIIAFILIIISVVTVVYTVLEEIIDLYTLIPYILIGFVIVLIITLILSSRLRNWIKVLFSIISFLIIVAEILFMIYGVTTFKFLNQITDTGLRVETYGIYVKNSSPFKSIKELDNRKVAYLYIPNDVETQDAIDKTIEDNNVNLKLESKDTLEDLLTSVNDGDTNAIFMNKSYESVAEEEYGDAIHNLKCIYSIDMVNYVKTTKSNKKITKDTYAIYISGIDTSGKVASKARSDVNIVMIVNPRTYQVLLINTPRDYYVDLASNNKKDKLTHAGLSGIEESSNTLAKLYDIDIDYYLRINFTSFVKIINSLGGINVNVSKAFCEQDSKRNFDNQICLRKGMQNLNGEQTLAYARHRHTLPQGDISRGENQMEIIKAIINKAASPAIIKNYTSLIAALSGNIVTNMETDEMYEVAKAQLSKNPTWTISSITATGKVATKPCYALGNANASVVIPDEVSILGIKNAINNIYTDKTNIIVEPETTTKANN